MDLFGLPKVLRPNDGYWELSGKKTRIQKCTPSFPVWTNKPPKFSFGNKRFLNFKGNPVFAEIYILRLLEEAGWDGVWVETFGGFKFLREMPTDSKLVGLKLPPLQDAFLQSLSKAVGKGGIFDIFAWKDNNFIFCESKELKKDRFQETQNKWVNAVLKLGIKPENLLVVEWSAH